MAQYNFREIEKKWQQRWEEEQLFKAEVNPDLPKYYVLDMFPYPSGAGLHVGHPLGYIASDIVSRFKRLKGYNVLHPMGFDSFGLPAEQYAIQTGQHPAITTEQNITRYIAQLKNIGFSYDWSKEVRTSSPDYYKWTQWIFMRLFDSWYNKKTNKAEPIDSLLKEFENSGNAGIQAVCDEDTPVFSAQDWKGSSERKQQEILLKYRLTYLAHTTVNWCPQLGTVLANEEVKDGVSERGGYPVIRKEMQQWSMRITAYAERLLQGLEEIDWPEPLKEMQRNWIGKSIGAQFYFEVEGSHLKIKVFTTRIDTIFGVTYLALAPEYEDLPQLTTPDRKEAVEEYVETARNRSERDRMSDIKTISGTFTGSYAINPFSGERIPIWIADYVLAGYGTGAVMAVPASDTRDYAFAKHFNLPIRQVIEGGNLDIEANDAKEGKMVNSDFLNGMEVKDAMELAVRKLEDMGIGEGKVNYRMRDAIFSRQRYWGEPVPVYFKDGMPYLIDESELPLVLPEVDAYLPTETGEPPLGRAEGWKYQGKYDYELSTMPGWAGSSWYFFRYMDPHNDQEFCSKEAQIYWENVDLYIGGSEHATGHLLYSRFWTKFLHDLRYVTVDEPFKKLINQGMISSYSYFLGWYQGSLYEPGKLVYSVDEIAFIASEGYFKTHSYPPYVEYKDKKVNGFLSKKRIPIDYVENGKLYKESFQKLIQDPLFQSYLLNVDLDGNVIWDIDEKGEYIELYSEVEKMSKSKYNVVNPDDVVEKFGADTLRLYEMFLGPLEQSKPWNTNGISGVHGFLKKLWRLFHDEVGNFTVSDAAPTKEELKSLHKTIKKVQEDIDRFSFNTSVSTFMICVNELTALKCNKKAVLSDLLIIVSPYAPHIAEELWQLVGHTDSIAKVAYPAFNEAYLAEDVFEYPISINGKLRTKMTFSLDTTAADIEKSVLASELVQKWLEGKAPKKIIIVPKKIVNVVI